MALAAAGAVNRRLTPPTTPTHGPVALAQSAPVFAAPSTPKLVPKSPALNAGHPVYPSSVPTQSLVPNSPRPPVPHGPLTPSHSHAHGHAHAFPHGVVPNSPRTAKASVQHVIFGSNSSSGAAAPQKPAPIMLPPTPLSPPALKLHPSAPLFSSAPQGLSGHNGHGFGQMNMNMGMAMGMNMGMAMGMPHAHHHSHALHKSLMAGVMNGAAGGQIAMPMAIRS
jgi:hypothetical protein